MGVLADTLGITTTAEDHRALAALGHVIAPNNEFTEDEFARTCVLGHIYEMVRIGKALLEWQRRALNAEHECAMLSQQLDALRTDWNEMTSGGPK